MRLSAFRDEESVQDRQTSWRGDAEVEPGFHHLSWSNSNEVSLSIQVTVDVSEALRGSARVINYSKLNESYSDQGIGWYVVLSDKERLQSLCSVREFLVERKLLRGGASSEEELLSSVNSAIRLIEPDEKMTPAQIRLQKTLEDFEAVKGFFSKYGENSPVSYTRKTK